MKRVNVTYTAEIVMEIEEGQDPWEILDKTEIFYSLNGERNYHFVKMLEGFEIEKED